MTCEFISFRTKLKSQTRHKNKTNEIKQQSALVLLCIANIRAAGQ